MTRVVLCALLPICVAAQATAQTSVGVGYRTDRYYGQAAQSMSDGGVRLRVRPFRPDLAELTVQQQIGDVRIGLVFSRFNAGFGVEGSDGVILQVSPPFRTAELAAEAAVTLRQGVRLGGGPVLGRWTIEGEPVKWVWGGQAALDFEAPVVRRLVLYGRLAAAVIPSPLAGGSLGPDARGTLTRRSLVAGLRLRL